MSWSRRSGPTAAHVPRAGGLRNDFWSGPGQRPGPDLRDPRKLFECYMLAHPAHHKYTLFGPYSYGPTLPLHHRPASETSSPCRSHLSTLISYEMNFLWHRKKYHPLAGRDHPGPSFFISVWHCLSQFGYVHLLGHFQFLKDI